MSNPLFNIQYSLFVITTCDEGRDRSADGRSLPKGRESCCINNTVAQVMAQPSRISVAQNKGNYTTELIQRTGKFTASILSEATDSIYMPTAKKIFGDKSDAFQAVNSDEQKRENLGADVLTTYVKKHGLTAIMYQDYGGSAKKLGD